MAVASSAPFGVHNLPFGVVSGLGPQPVCVVRVDDRVVDLAALARQGRVSQPPQLFEGGTLDAYLAAGRATWTATRQDAAAAARRCRRRGPARAARSADVTPVLPFTVADYVDFYSSQHHAENVGRMFRPDSPALPPNWKHLPIGYHGRAGTVVVSGTPVVRPSGQRRPPESIAPVFGPSQRLDIEVEVGFVVGTPLAARLAGADVRVRGACVRDCAAQRLVGSRHPGLGVPAARPVPRQVVRDLDLAVGGSAGRLGVGARAVPGAGPRAAAVPAYGRELGARPRARGRAQRHGGVATAVRDHVLDAGPAARAHDGQRRFAAHRRSVCLRDGERPGAGSAGLVPRAVLGRQRAVRAG